jgi:uncharacterized protein
MLKTAAAALMLLLLLGVDPAPANVVRRGQAALSRGDYQQAAHLLLPAANRGNPRAQAMLGFLYENGFGVPQNYDVAFDFYGAAAERGDPQAQYLLGLLYDKGFGTGRSEILAYKWLSLAAAGASQRDRANYLRIRNALASKMSRASIEEGQWLAVSWRARP